MTSDSGFKKNVHNTGPLGLLINSGQISSIEPDEGRNKDDALRQTQTSTSAPSTGFFKTASGIPFEEQELALVDPNACEPWHYANRLDAEMGEMDELVQSIRDNNQLQPALVRPHPRPHDGIKYEIIFGRRRHLACTQLNKSFLVIIKQFSDQEAIAYQDAENKFRKDISNYSNALLYKKLLDDRVFKSERELSKKLNIPSSNFNDLMAYTKIPVEIVKALPDVHSLSKSLAVKIAALFKLSKENQQGLLALAPEIGKTITSPGKLERALAQRITGIKISIASETTRLFKLPDGKPLFSLKTNYLGSPCIVINKELKPFINYDDLCQHLIAYFGSLDMSGATDK